MKTPIAVTLMTLGALLGLIPALSDHFYREKFLALISRPGADLATIYYYFNALMDYQGQLACWSAGTALLSAAFLFRRRRVA